MALKATKNQTANASDASDNDGVQRTPAPTLTEADLQEQLLSYYTDSDTAEMPPDSLKEAFEKCFKATAPGLISMKPKKFDKKYDNDVRKILLKLNDNDCKPSTAADVLSPAYVEQVQQRWNNSGTIRRAFNKLVAKVFGAANNEYLKCFNKVLNATIPELLCVDEQDRAVILAKCVQNTTLPEIKDASTAANDKDGTVKLKRLGRISKFLVDNFICPQPKLRPGVKSAWNILKTWPVHFFLGIIGGAIAILFWGWISVGGDMCGIFTFCLGWIPGGILAVIWLVGYTLYTLFGIPWKLFWDLAKKSNEHDDYGFKTAFKSVKERAKDYMGGNYFDFFRR